MKGKGKASKRATYLGEQKKKNKALQRKRKAKINTQMVILYR